MRIFSIEQPAGFAPDFAPDGLAEVSMRDLNRIVILAGANGAGKSRLLARVARGVGHCDEQPYRDSVTFIDTSGQRVFPASGLGVVPFVSRNLAIEDPFHMNPSDALTNAAKAAEPGAYHLAESTLAYIHRTQQHWWYARHPDAEEPNRPDQKLNTETKVKMISGYESLRETIRIVLGSTLSIDPDGRPMLFGRTFTEVNLSDGQRRLLQWCVALHAQGGNLTDRILLMDEPESNLHPDALISTIERVASANLNGQMWIATHSLPLIASLYKRFDREISLYCIEEGVIGFAGARPERVIKSLMGGEQNIEALREFVDLPEVLATNRFAAECLVAPETLAGNGPGDPQVEIFCRFRGNRPSRWRLLDFGCGRGRVLQTLLAREGEAVSRSIDYVGWDVTEKHRAECAQVLINAYGDATDRWFCDQQQLARLFSSGPFDCVLMCNVLHEISPIDWVRLFGLTGTIASSLSSDGYVVIIEDYLMPKGEYAHPFGFIVLDTQALQELFGAGEGDNSIGVLQERAGRIKGHLVPKKLLSNVSNATVRTALDFAQRNAKDHLEVLRRGDAHDFRSGRAHGFWVQQFANTTLALLTLPNP